jgi:hypothetical protein
MIVRVPRNKIGDSSLTYSINVPDKRIRNIPKVVLVRRWVRWGSGNFEGEGWVGGWDKGGSVYKQPETEVDDSCHS